MFEKRLEEMEIGGRVETFQKNYSFVKIAKNAEKRHWELRRFAVPQTPEKGRQYTLLWKTSKE